MRDQILEIEKYKRSLLVVLLGITYQSCSLPDPRARINMTASFSVLSLLTNVIRCLIN